jgi:hypothetical protein
MDKRSHRLIRLLAAAAMVLGLAAASIAEDMVQRSGEGSVNWTTGVIQAKGIGAPPEKHYSTPSARPLALRAAKLDALRNMLEVINGVRIDSTTTVKDFSVESDVIRSEVDGWVRGAEQVHTEYMSDGTVEVVMQVNMRGGFSRAVLPENIKQLETITPVEPAPDATSPFTGLIVDARGLHLRPAMAPKVLDESGEQVYGSAFVSREHAISQGVAGYAKAMRTAKDHPRVADTPLTVKGLRTEGPGRCDIVISDSDASRVRSASEHLSFLKKCRVMIVVD